MYKIKKIVLMTIVLRLIQSLKDRKLLLKKAQRSKITLKREKFMLLPR